ncbi:U-box domain-containing protein 14 [Ancistrocladus abbreviatus]
MGPIGDPNNTVLTRLIQTIKEISTLPECKNTSKIMYSNLMRRVKLLSPLFEELTERDDELGVAEIQALESLSVALDSAKELLQWVNETSKLYQVVHRDIVSLKFLKTTEQIEEALSKMPYNQLDLSEEVREQIELVHAQFRRLKWKGECRDPQLEMDMAIMQEEAEPDAAVLRRLSDNLHLKTIDDLRKESRAFHEMVVTTGADLGNSFETLTYLFKKLNDYLLSVIPEKDTCDVEKETIKHRSPVIPDDFRCPISLELMKDPVIVSTGQTYERSCIQKWLDAGHKTCPKTQQTLLHTALTPNYVLKSLITLWCENNGVELPKKQGNCRNKRSGSSSLDCDQAAINELLRKLKHGNIEEQRAAAGELRLLAKRNADNRVCIAEAGAIPLLVELLSSPDSRAQEHAVTALLNLSIHETNKSIIVDAGAVSYIVEVLKYGSVEARENAAATLFSLSVVDENKVAIGAAGAIPALIDLLCEGTPRGKKDAATAIFNLSIYQGNKVRAVRAGIVPPLMGLLKDPGGGMVDEALAILAILASHPEGKIAIGQVEPIPILLEIIRTGSPRNRENAAAVLWSLCMGDARHLTVARKLGAGEVLRELSENGTDRAKRKAGSLLELLQRVESNSNQ